MSPGRTAAKTADEAPQRTSVDRNAGQIGELPAAITVTSAAVPAGGYRWGADAPCTVEILHRAAIEFLFRESSPDDIPSTNHPGAFATLAPAS